MPIATPADANNAANEVVLIPNAPTTETINKTLSNILTKLLRNVWILISTFRRDSILLITRWISEIRKRPTM